MMLCGVTNMPLKIKIDEIMEVEGNSEIVS
jgi:hypothetical protein